MRLRGATRSLPASRSKQPETSGCVRTGGRDPDAAPRARPALSYLPLLAPSARVASWQPRPGLHSAPPTAALPNQQLYSWIPAIPSPATPLSVRAHLRVARLNLCRKKAMRRGETQGRYQPPPPTPVQAPRRCHCPSGRRSRPQRQPSRTPARRPSRRPSRWAHSHRCRRHRHCRCHRCRRRRHCRCHRCRRPRVSKLS